MMRRMMAMLAVGVLGGVFGGLTAPQAKADPVVIELYTSQGCSSCPPADAYMTELAARDDVIALSLHVDYWDYIGWKDSFGSPHFTARQKAYARAAGERSVYTPQMIVGGAERVVGNHPRDLGLLIRKHAARPDPVKMELVRGGGKLTIRARAVGQISGPVAVQLVRYIPSASVRIKRGENAGRVIDYSNIVTEWQHIGEWDGQGPLALSVPVSGSDPVVVILQGKAGKKGPGLVLAAAQLR